MYKEGYLHEYRYSTQSGLKHGDGLRGFIQGVYGVNFRPKHHTIDQWTYKAIHLHLTLEDQISFTASSIFSSAFPSHRNQLPSHQSIAYLISIQLVSISAIMVKTIPFGTSGINVNSPGFGCMGLSMGLGTNMTPEEAEPVLLKAIELGCTFWDTAVVYAAGINESLLGDFIRKHNVRDKIFIASKCGFAVFEKAGVTNSAKHIKQYINGTIERLGFTPDLYYLHRIDPNTPLEESITALDEIRKAGKTKFIGLSECSAGTLKKANAIAKIDAVQAEYSAFEVNRCV
jgi:hypothetical protein